MDQFEKDWKESTVMSESHIRLMWKNFHAKCSIDSNGDPVRKARARSEEASRVRGQMKGDPLRHVLMPWGGRPERSAQPSVDMPGEGPPMSQREVELRQEKIELTPHGGGFPVVVEPSERVGFKYGSDSFS